MCILFLSYSPPGLEGQGAGTSESKYLLIAADNRDENLQRPTAPAQYWQDHPQLLAGTSTLTPHTSHPITGRDLMVPDGGTWFGVTTEGRFSVLTNSAGGELDPDAQSRGELTRIPLHSSIIPSRSPQYWVPHWHHLPYGLLSADRPRELQWLLPHHS